MRGCWRSVTRTSRRRLIAGLLLGCTPDDGIGKGMPMPIALKNRTVAAPERFVALDVVRGLVMVLMAIDHVRVYSGVPAGGPSAGVFFTRWVTHFCAPAFAF